MDGNRRYATGKRWSWMKPRVKLWDLVHTKAQLSFNGWYIFFLQDDPEMWGLIQEEKARQRLGLELISSILNSTQLNIEFNSTQYWTQLNSILNSTRFNWIRFGTNCIRKLLQQGCVAGTTLYAMSHLHLIDIANDIWYNYMRTKCILFKSLSLSSDKTISPLGSWIVFKQQVQWRISGPAILRRHRDCW